MKLLIILAELLLPLQIINAGSTLIIELTSGKTAYFNLKEKPVLTMSGTKLKVESSSLSTDYERKDVKRFYFVSETTDILPNVSKTTSYSQTTVDILTISNLESSDQIVVADLKGRMYNHCISRSLTEATIDLSNCSKGIYLIKIGNKQTLKIIKK